MYMYIHEALLVLAFDVVLSVRLFVHPAVRPVTCLSHDSRGLDCLFMEERVMQSGVI